MDTRGNIGDIPMGDVDDFAAIEAEEDTEEEEEWDERKRKRMLRDLRKKWDLMRKQRELVTLCDPDDDDSIGFFLVMENLSMLEYFSASASRYVDRQPTYRKNGIAKFLETELDQRPGSWCSPREFKIRYRMSRQAFRKLHLMIKDHPIFRTQPGKKSQAPSEYQLLVLLAFLGTEGAGMSDRRARSSFPNGSGSFGTYKKRCLKAIIDNLSHEAYSWPDSEERKHIARCFHQEHFIPGVVGVADGTLLPLAFKPSRADWPDFKGRKLLYTITVMIVNDHKRRIRYYHAGFPGKAHDERVYRNTPLATRPEEYFNPGEFLLGDSAFTPRSTMVPCYKKPANGELDPEFEEINTILAKPRVSSEHAIGMLKSRFPMLRSIRIKITEEKKSFKLILQYLRVCVILHNLLIGWDEADEYYDDDVEDDDRSLYDADNSNNRPDSFVPNGFCKREELRSYFSENNTYAKVVQKHHEKIRNNR